MGFRILIAALAGAALGTAELPRVFVDLNGPQGGIEHESVVSI